MKKILLLIVAVMVSFGASADNLVKSGSAMSKIRGSRMENVPQLAVKSLKNVPQAVQGKRQVVRKAEGEMDFNYANLRGAFYTMFGFMLSDGLVGYVVYNEDHTKVMVNNFFPMMGMDIWVEGTVSGKTVSFSRQAVGSLPDEEGGEITLYFSPLNVSADGESIMCDLAPLKMNIADDGTLYIPGFGYDDAQEGLKYIGLVAGSMMSPDLYDYSANVEFQPFSADMVEVPEGANSSEYIYSYQTNGGFEHMKRGEVRTVGNDYYFSLLAPDAVNAWVKGTRNGDKVECEGNQFIGTDGMYWLFFNPTKIVGIDEEYGTYITESADKFVLDYDGTTFTSGEEVVAGETLVDGSLYEFGENFNIAPFVGLEREVPSDAYALQLADYTEDYGQYYFGFYFDNIGANGKYLEPENLSVRIYVDDEPYVFTPDEYALLEEMPTLPWGFADEADGYDLLIDDNGEAQLWMYIGMFEKVGVQVVYNYNGEELVSNIVYVDEEGEETIVPAATGVLSVKADNNLFTSYYDLQGRKTLAPAKGQIYIKGGKKVLK